MDDLISRAEALTAIEFEKKNVFKAIEDAPAVDAVPVVRCKDCIYYGVGATETWCGIFNGMMKPHDEGFCSYGERRGDSI